MINIISTSFHLSIWCSHFIWQRLGCIIFYSCPKPLPAYLRTLQMRWQMLLTTAKCIVLWHEVPLLLYLMSMVSMDRAGLIMFGFPLKNPKPLVGQKLLSCRHTTKFTFLKFCIIQTSSLFPKLPETFLIRKFR